MGTRNSANDEWIELHNNTSSPINLDGWILKATDGNPEIKLAGIIPADGFYLLERTDDNTMPNISADQVYAGALNNKGEDLELYDNSGGLIDLIDGLSGWPAGDNSTKQTMSRLGPNQWRSSKEPGGTPKAANTFATDAVEDHPQPTQPNKELAAAGEPIRQGQGNSFNAVQDKQAPILFAIAIAIFSGTIILALKKRIK